jgi:hypothetical protein
LPVAKTLIMIAFMHTNSHARQTRNSRSNIALFGNTETKKKSGCAKPAKNGSGEKPRRQASDDQILCNSPSDNIAGASVLFGTAGMGGT